MTRSSKPSQKPVKKALRNSRLVAHTLKAMGLTASRDLARGKPEAFREGYPIVLMHGLAGFRDISLGSVQLFEYFNGVVDLLRQHGYQAFAPRVSPFAKPQVRAAFWFHELEKIRRVTGAEKLHLIGHSQGGLDARVLAAPASPAQDTPLGPLQGMGYGPHIASITSIGTPHLGSVLVDQIDNDDGTLPELVDTLTDVISIFARVFDGGPNDAEGAIRALSGGYMNHWFNPAIADNPDVPCYTIAGDPEKASNTSPLFQLSYNAIMEVPIMAGGGPNDGLVSVKSAFFGSPPPKFGAAFICTKNEDPRPHWQPLGVITADHVAMTGIPVQVGPNRHFDHSDLFLGLAQMLHNQDSDKRFDLQLDGSWMVTGACEKAPDENSSAEQPAQNDVAAA